MGYARIRAVGLVGVNGHPVTVETHVDRGLPKVVLSGLPDAVLHQARDRVRSAVVNSGFTWPDQRIAVNLLPASLPKHGSAFDLAIAVGILVASDQVPASAVEDVVLLGELGLDGKLRPVAGVLPALISARGAAVPRGAEPPSASDWITERPPPPGSRAAPGDRPPDPPPTDDSAPATVPPADTLAAAAPEDAIPRPGLIQAIVSIGNLREAALAPGIRVRGATSLKHAVSALLGTGGELVTASPEDARDEPSGPDIVDVVGQERARRALEIAAAGGHNLLFVGPPGAGKTMLAERLPSLLPRLDDQAAMEVTAVHSIAGQLGDDAHLIRTPPFQAPHHSVTVSALVGGGSSAIRPGALSLAHRGVLFLDEAPEFRRDVLDALRQPLEKGEINVARSRSVTRFPAKVQLVLAANPCPCAAAKAEDCNCRPDMRRRYLAKLSGPLLDRVDIQLMLPPVGSAALRQQDREQERSEVVAERVLKARETAMTRWLDAGFGRLANAEVSGTRLRTAPWRLSRDVTGVAEWMMDKGRLTARGFDRILRVAWTISDLAGRDRPDEGDVAEATELRLGHTI